MKNTASYSMEIKDEYRCFYGTYDIYQDAVSFLIKVVNAEYDEIEDVSSSNKRQSIIEKLVHGTSKREARYKAFDKKFFKFPSYLRRSAINAAIGAVSSYRSNLASWEASDKSHKRPRLKVNRNEMPVFYKGNMFQLVDDEYYQCRIKIFINNDWNWKLLRFRKTDLAYLEKKDLELSQAKSGVLEKKGKRFALRFAFKSEVQLADTKERILSCDIGINNAAVVSVMEEDGTVLERRFITFPVEEDRFNKVLNQRKRAHSDSCCKTHRLDRFADNYNRELSIKTSSAIVSMAVEYECDVIVMENLSGNKGRIHGSKAMRLSLWRKRDIVKRVEALAHSKGIRFSTVCAINTSRLAYDGTGEVVRDKDNHSLCTFTTGKRYNTDLSASYNIGARYFAREIWKSLPGKVASTLKAKVPELWYGAHCTLSTLINLYAVKDDLSSFAESRLFSRCAVPVF